MLFAAKWLELGVSRTWTPAAGRALVWHPLYPRHTPNQRAPFDRGNCGPEPAHRAPYSASPTTSQPETRATRHGWRGTAATAAVPPRHIWGAAGSATRPSCHGRPGSDGPDAV